MENHILLSNIGSKPCAMNNPDYRFLRFWERTRRINKWRFAFPVGLASGLMLLGSLQLMHREQLDLYWFFAELLGCLAAGIFLIGPLTWSRNERKFIRILRAIHYANRTEWQLVPSAIHHVSGDRRETSV